MYGTKPWISENGCITLKLQRKRIFQHVKSYLHWKENQRRTYTVALKKELSELDKSFLTGFLRGIFDTEGFVNIAKHYIGICVVSEGLANNVSDILSMLKIQHYRYKFTPKPPRKMVYDVRVVKMKSLALFNSMVGFGNPLKQDKLSMVLRAGFEPAA